MDIIRRPKSMKNYGIIKHRFIVSIDMLFCYLFLGYEPAAYASYTFQNLTLSKILTFIPTYEYILFINFLNVDFNKEILNNKKKTYENLRDFYGREQITIKTEEDFQLFNDFVSRHKKFFFKPLYGSLGAGAGLANIEKIDVKAFFGNLISSGEYVIEELINQHKDISSFHPSSVNTIRVVVLKAERTTEILFGCLRCGSGGRVVDNGAAGGIFIPFDPQNGCLLKYGFDEYGRKYTSHPDTKIKFEGFQIPFFNELKVIAIKATESLQGLKYVGWDIAITKDKIMIVEGNICPTMLILEGLHKTGFKAELRSIARSGNIPVNFRAKLKNIC